MKMLMFLLIKWAVSFRFRITTECIHLHCQTVNQIALNKGNHVKHKCSLFGSDFKGFKHLTDIKIISRCKLAKLWTGYNLTDKVKRVFHISMMKNPLKIFHC